MAEETKDPGQQKTSKIARFILKPPKVAPKKLEHLTGYSSKAAFDASPSDAEPPWELRQPRREYQAEGAYQQQPQRKHLKLGDRVLISGARYGTLRYYGETQFSDGIWCGVELDEPSGGKNSGVVNGVLYFACRPSYGIFAPESKVELVSGEGNKVASYLPGLSQTPEPCQQGPTDAPSKSKGPSFLSRLPKLGIPSVGVHRRHSSHYYMKDQKSANEESLGPGTRSAIHHRFYDHWSDGSYDTEATQRAYRSAYPSLGGYEVRDTASSAVSYSGGYPSEERTTTRRQEAGGDLRPSVSHLNSRANEQLSPGEVATNDEYSPVHDEWEKGDQNSDREDVSNAEEATGGADSLSSIRGAMDDVEDPSHPESLGILNASSMRDITASAEGQVVSGFVPKSFSTDDVADLPEEEHADSGTFGAAASDTEDKVPTFISSEVLRILRYNFPDLVDNLNSVIARNQASLAEEFKEIPAASELPCPPFASLPDAMTSKPSTVDSAEYSSGLATSIGSIECDLASSAVQTSQGGNELTEVNLSVLQDDGERLKRPASVYTVQSTDTGFQGDSELDCQSEAGAAISPCEDKTMRWSTCSSQDSGAVSESGSEFQRRNLHLDCCSECCCVATSDRQCRLRLLPPQDTHKEVSSPDVPTDITPEETKEEAGTEVLQDDQQSHATDVEPESTDPQDKQDQNLQCAAAGADSGGDQPSRGTEIVEPEESAGPSEAPRDVVQPAGTTKKKPVRPPPKVVVSKIKAMIEASSSKLEGEATVKKAPRQPKKNRWDAVTSKLAASIADEKAKPKVKEVRSKIFTNLEGAKQQQQQPRQTPAQVHRRLLPSSTSSRASTRTECDTTSTASEQFHADGRRESLASPCDGSTASTKNGTAESVATVNVGGATPREQECTSSSGPSVDKKSRAPAKRPDYPRPWMVSKTQAKEAQKDTSAPQSALAKRNTSPTQTKAPCMPKSVRFSASATALQAQRQPEANKKPNSTLKVPIGIQGRGKAGGDTRAGHPLTKAEFTKEIQRLGALCEARTKEANFLKLQLKHASAGFAAFSILLRHLTEQHNVFSIPHLTEELQKSRQEIDRAHVAIEQYKKDIEQLKQKQLEEIKAMKEKVARERALQLEELEAAHKSEISFYTESHAKKTEELKIFYTSIIEGDRKSHDDAIDALREKHREKIEAINEEYAIQLDAINDEHTAQQAQLEAKHAALVDQYRALQEQAREFQSSVLLDTDSKIQWLSKKNADLEKEVDSLNVVLEMRAEQIQALQRSKLEMERKEEELERCKDRIQKLEARNEDLQELLNEKAKMQSQLSLENAVLREKSEKQNRQLSRLDMTNEQLKYKLRESTNTSFTYERGSVKPRTSPPKRFSGGDPTAMSRSWHSERSSGGATRKTSSLRSQQRSLTLPHSNNRQAGCQPDNRKVRRSMSDSVPNADCIRTRLFSTDEEDNTSFDFERSQCSHDELLRLTWVCSPEGSDNSRVSSRCKKSPNQTTSSSSESGGSLPDQAYNDGLSDGSSSVDGQDVTLNGSAAFRGRSPRCLAGEAMVMEETATVDLTAADKASEQT